MSKTPEQKILKRIAKNAYERESEALPNNVYPSRWKNLSKGDRKLQLQLSSFTILALADVLEEVRDLEDTATIEDVLYGLRVLVP